VKFGRYKSMKSCVICHTQKKTKFRLPLKVSLLRGSPKICQSQPPIMYSQYSRFHPNLFTFGGVIAERVNTAKSPRKVNPIFSRRLSSSRIQKNYLHIYISAKVIVTTAQQLFGWPTMAQLELNIFPPPRKVSLSTDRCGPHLTENS